ncbi:MAG: N-acetylmuramoyl-L-alanine amidase [Deltaproteobacteria bacterium]|nr:N-acetylmuramoyl-L-alanine amidase [Deltaproteobacteria bacterium]
MLPAADTLPATPAAAPDATPAAAPDATPAAAPDATPAAAPDATPAAAPEATPATVPTAAPDATPTTASDPAPAAAPAAVPEATPAAIFAPPATLLPPGGRVVVIDPGHGSLNSGALGPGRIEEKQITMLLARRAKAVLEEASELRVALTRLHDVHVGLKERAEAANQLGAGLLLSIHCNSASYIGPRGHETYFLGPTGNGHAGAAAAGDNGQATPAAAGGNGHARGGEPPRSEPAPGNSSPEQEAPQHPTVAHDEATLQRSAELARLIAEEMASRLAGPSRGVRQASFDVLLHSISPAAVVEVGFLNHPQEGPWLADPLYQERIARALASAVLRFFALPPLPPERGAFRPAARQPPAQPERPRRPEASVGSQRGTGA